VATRRADQPGLFDAPTPRLGRHERAVARAIARAQRDGLLDTTLDGGLSSVARGLGRAIDGAEAARNPWAVAQVARELRETLTRLRLDPAARGADRDSWDDFLAALTDPAGTGPVGDTPQP
jgi:hypothetical protein